MSGLGRMLAYNPPRQARRIKLACSCGKRLPLSGSGDFSGKRHAYCKRCHLEWHLLPNGRTYTHPK